MLDRHPGLTLTLIREFSARMRATNIRYLDEIIQGERLALVGRSARTIVHDFKNPLVVIRLAAEMTGASDHDHGHAAEGAGVDSAPGGPHDLHAE